MAHALDRTGDELKARCFDDTAVASERASRECTEQERAAFKHAYGKRLKWRIVMIAILFASMASLAINEERIGDFLGPIALVVLAAAWVIFEHRNWRCPACDQNLGRAFNPRKCRACGNELRG